MKRLKVCSVATIVPAFRAESPDAALINKESSSVPAARLQSALARVIKRNLISEHIQGQFFAAWFILLVYILEIILAGLYLKVVE